MYTVLIADDEDIIRRGFVEFIPWEELGFKVVCTCENGNQVIDYIRRSHVDFILTDIVMVGASGLDIAKYIHDNSIPTIVCLISGHKNFEYARSAMKYGVKYYITKPTDFNDVTELLKEIKTQLDAARSPETLEARRTQFFYDLFMGSLPDGESINSAAAELGFNSDDIFICPFWITVSNFDNYVEEKWNYGKELLFTALFNFLRDNLKQFGIYSILINGYECLYLAVCGRSSDDLEDTLKAELDALKESIQLLMELDITYQTGHTYRSLSDFYKCFSSGVTGTDKSAGGEGKNRLLLMEQYKNVIFSLILGSPERINAVFDNIARTFSHMDEKTLSSALSELADIVCDKLKSSLSKDFSSVYSKYADKLKNSKSRNEILENSKDFLTAVSENINAKSSPSEMIIEKAKDYIDEHFADNISLYDVANYVFLNASYLSRLFKQYTGENFRDYLISIRIARAIELMKQNRYKIYEISELCGYKNPKYFAQQFKQVTGLAPTEYLSRMGG